jgi:putative SOS response-associated peptidase YedK
MCGRFTQKYTWQELAELYRLNQTPQNIRSAYNICPTDPVGVIIPGGNGLFLMPMRWGLIPRWWSKSLKELPATFNARVETVANKPMFRDAFRQNRCIIPASGYYEWQTTPEGKQPYFISPRNGSILSFAGLWDEWRDRLNNETICSCTIIITNANTFTRTIHDRMPAILERENVGAWLSGEAGTELLKPASDDILRMWPVSKRVSKPGNTDDATLIWPVELRSSASKPQGDLLLH